MTRYSKQLARLAEKDDRIAEYEYDPGNDCGAHWLHLKFPYLCHDGGAIHEYTVKECLDKLYSIYNPEEVTA